MCVKGSGLTNLFEIFLAKSFDLQYFSSLGIIKSILFLN